MRLEGKVALDTGGGRGLGEAICRTLAREGAHIAVSDIRISDAERVANVIKQMARKSIAIKADVYPNPLVVQHADELLDRHGHMLTALHSLREDFD